MTRSNAWKSGQSDASVDTDTRSCGHPACGEEGLYRAPRSRDHLRSFYWFCLDHVREYNKAWNYYAGMSADEIEAHIRADVVGRRPTWPMGWWARRRAGLDYDTVRDGFGFFAHDGKKGAEKAEGAERDDKQNTLSPTSAEAKALSTMDLTPPLTLDKLKARYKELVKRFHPDTHGGDKAAEERLKLINQAYTTLRNSVTT